MTEIQKLTKEQFAEETTAIYIHVFRQLDKLFDKHPKIDADFEKDIDELHKISVGQMVEYGKVLAEKDQETSHEYRLASLFAMAKKAEKLESELNDFEKRFDEKMPELQAYGGNNLNRKFKDFFGIMDFMDVEQIKEDHPVSAKEFGIE
ncbi:MAG: hypothetical protein PHP52_07945 [Bacteroidales bacterium]|nr:hypothetical protein [Bacteroidales bacterium]MDY0142549.1 hypothetical protein [Bacteroidales bacterium]